MQVRRLVCSNLVQTFEDRWICARHHSHKGARRLLMITCCCRPNSHTTASARHAKKTPPPPDHRPSGRYKQRPPRLQKVLHYVGEWTILRYALAGEFIKP